MKNIDEAVARRVRDEILPGETLLYYDRKEPSFEKGVITLVFGVPCLIYGTYDIILGNEIALSAFVLLFGFTFTWAGLYCIVSSRANYYFVTDKRLCCFCQVKFRPHIPNEKQTTLNKRKVGFL